MDNLPTKTTAPPRKKVTHGIKFWLRTGKINPSIRGYKKIQKYLMDLEMQLIEESGGQANLTAAREILIRSTIRGYGVIMLAELYSSKFSILRPDDAKRGVMSFQPILERSYANIFGQVRQNLLALGLDKRMPAEPSILTYIAEFDAQKAAQEAKVGAERPVVASADSPECPGKGTGEGENGISREEGENRRARMPVGARSPEGEAQGQGSGAGEEGKP